MIGQRGEVKGRAVQRQPGSFIKVGMREGGDHVGPRGIRNGADGQTPTFPARHERELSLEIHSFDATQQHRVNQLSHPGSRQRLRCARDSVSTRKTSAVRTSGQRTRAALIEEVVLNLGCLLSPDGQVPFFVAAHLVEFAILMDRIGEIHFVPRLAMQRGGGLRQGRGQLTDLHHDAVIEDLRRLRPQL